MVISTHCSWEAGTDGDCIILRINSPIGPAGYRDEYYENAPHEVKTSEQDLHAALFSNHPKAFALICSINDSTVGFALYFFNFSD